MKKFLLALALFGSAVASADVYLVNGERLEGEVHEIDGALTLCTDEMCLVLPPDAVRVDEEAESQLLPANCQLPTVHSSSRLGQGYMDVETFLAFLEGAESPQASPFEGKAWYVVLILTFLGGLAMNLTPCVLPMVPINLMIIGKSALRGALYGLGIALAYGTLGLLAALGGMAFGEIQGNPWFNLAVAVLFFVLSLSLFGVFMLDFSKHRPQGTKKGLLFPFVMGAVCAVLAGACIAPILVAVLLLTAKLYAEGNVLALGLPFVLGLGMALPWPFAGAGMKVLPKPGAWMTKVNKVFALIVLGFALWYGYLAWIGFGTSTLSIGSDPIDNVIAVSSPAEFEAAIKDIEGPIFVDCWATWCKNCAAMEETTFADPAVKAALQRYTIVKLQAESIADLTALPRFSEVKGLPAYLTLSIGSDPIDNVKRSSITQP